MEFGFEEMPALDYFCRGYGFTRSEVGKCLVVPMCPRSKHDNRNVEIVEAIFRGKSRADCAREYGLSVGRVDSIYKRYTRKLHEKIQWERNVVEYSIINSLSCLSDKIRVPEYFVLHAILNPGMCGIEPYTKEIEVLHKYFGGGECTEPAQTLAPEPAIKAMVALAAWLPSIYEGVCSWDESRAERSLKRVCAELGLTEQGFELMLKGEDTQERRFHPGTPDAFGVPMSTRTQWAVQMWAEGCSAAETAQRCRYSYDILFRVFDGGYLRLKKRTERLLGSDYAKRHPELVLPR